MNTSKEIRHQKAQEFKNEIALVSNRNLKIKELTANVSNLSEIDKLKITILFQKKNFFSGCELSFQGLIQQINLFGDSELQKQALAFANKNNIKL